MTKGWSEAVDEVYDAVRAEMARQGFTQHAYAAHIGMTQGTLSAMLNRRFPNQKIASIWRLAGGLGLKIELRVSRPGAEPEARESG